jgi:hypothetical protein
MPNVKGMGLKDALYLLENKGVKVVFKWKGKIITQSIPRNAINERLDHLYRIGLIICDAVERHIIQSKDQIGYWRH